MSSNWRNRPRPIEQSVEQGPMLSFIAFFYVFVLRQALQRRQRAFLHLAMATALAIVFLHLVFVVTVHNYGTTGTTRRFLKGAMFSDEGRKALSLMNVSTIEDLIKSAGADDIPSWYGWDYPIVLVAYVLSWILLAVSTVVLLDNIDAITQPNDVNHARSVAMKAWFDDLPLDFSRDETRAAERLLIAGFPTNAAAVTLAQNAGIDLSLLSQTEPVRFLIRDILSKARQADRLIPLLAEVLSDPSQKATHNELGSLVAGHEGPIAAAAMRRKPSVDTLALLPPSVDVWRPGPGTAQPLATPGLEKTINAAAGFTDPALFRFGLAQAEVRTARIDIGGKALGTGFLIGDSLLLTNWHVVKGGVEGAVAVFDKKVSLHGTREYDPGRVVSFASNWLVAHSVHEAVAQEIGPEGPREGNWDFAVVRLAEPVGAQAIGSDPLAVDAEKRGRYVLDGGRYNFVEAEPILIVGHPAGRPVQFSYASPSRVRLTSHHNRVRYETNTEAGSSGSPVFNLDWRVVALHHAAGPTSIPGEFNLSNGAFNQGVPIFGIVTELRKQLAGHPELAELGLE